MKISLLSVRFILAFLYAFPSLLFSQSFPAGFSQSQVATIVYPTGMDFAPDGRIFVCTKAGKIMIVKNGVVLSTPFLSLNVDQQGERGLSNIILDPNFNTNRYVYVYYTTASSPIHNRLSRFIANGDVAFPGETVLLDFEPVVNNIHNGGGMAWGADGKLYLSIGDDHNNTNPQNLNTYKGKLLRLNSDGSVPSGNPFSGSEPAKRIWAYGFRNPWSIAIQPGTGKLFVNDVGEGSWEEINDATSAGKNFGWPIAEGYNSNPAYANPVYAYPHLSSGSNGGCAITGGAFLNHPLNNYPAQYKGKYFFPDYCNRWINYIDPVTGTKSNFASGLDYALNVLKVGPDGNIYYFSIGTIHLYKIVYNGPATTAPVITSQPQPFTVTEGQPFYFTVSATGAAPLYYKWEKNYSAITTTTTGTYYKNAATFSDSGIYDCVVFNSYGWAVSNFVRLKVLPFNTKPEATISKPTAGKIYRAGETILVQGSATDREDGVIPKSRLSWIVNFHHDSHIHPGPFIPAGTDTGRFTISRTGEFSANVFYRIYLIATDSRGMKDTSHVDIFPFKSNLSFNTQPAGLQIKLDETPHATPYTVQAVSGQTRTIAPVSPQTLNGISYVFDRWNHGGSPSQSISITDNSSTYTAIYKRVTANQPPVCNIVSPTSRTFAVNTTIPLIVSASDPDGTIAKVEYFINGVLKGSDSGFPYNYDWIPNSAGAYSVYVRATDNSGGFTNSPVTTFNIVSCIATITPSGSPVFCSGSVTLKSNTGFGYLYQWKKDGVNIPGATSSTYTTSTPGYYQIRLNYNNCTAWSAPVQVSNSGSVQAIITPGGSTTICQTSSVKLYANTCSGFQYQWIRNGAIIVGAINPSYTATLAGNYQLRIKSGSSFAWSAITPVIYKDCGTIAISDRLEEITTSEETITEPESEVNVYPNPSSGTFTLNLRLDEPEESVLIKVLSIDGKEVYINNLQITEGIVNSTIELDHELPVGIYFLDIKNGNHLERVKLLLTR